MNEEKEPHKQMTEKNNDLNSTQEILYQKEFNKADEIIKDKKEKQRNENN